MDKQHELALLLEKYHNFVNFLRAEAPEGVKKVPEMDKLFSYPPSATFSTFAGLIATKLHKQQDHKDFIRTVTDEYYKLVDEGHKDPAVILSGEQKAKAVAQFVCPLIKMLKENDPESVKALAYLEEPTEPEALELWKATPLKLEAPIVKACRYLQLFLDAIPERQDDESGARNSEQ